MVSLMSQEIEIQALYPKSISSLRSRQSQLIKKREILLDGSEDLILSLYTKGMSVRDIQLHLDDLYGYELSTQTISNITDKVIEKAYEWRSCPLDKIYPIIFMDATVLKIRVSSKEYSYIYNAYTRR